MNTQPTAIYIPSLNRPRGLERVLLNIKISTPEPHMIYVMVSEDDLESQNICRKNRVYYWTDVDPETQYFVPRIQRLFEKTSEPWFFTGSDDIIFSLNWLTRCFSAAEDNIKVICPNDGHNPKGTNFLVNRGYVMERGGNWDTPGYVYHPSYRHNYSDDELVNVALCRGVYARALNVLVESTHPCWGNAPSDSTYGRAYEVWGSDENLYKSRTHLWGGKDLWR